MSPGWHPSSRQIASRVVKRTALAFPVFRMERLASVSPTRSASSLSDIFRLAISTSRFTMILPIARQIVKSCSSFSFNPMTNTSAVIRQNTLKIKSSIVSL